LLAESVQRPEGVWLGPGHRLAFPLERDESRDRQIYNITQGAVIGICSGNRQRYNITQGAVIVIGATGAFWIYEFQWII
jgi:hypothetical protein